MSTPEPTPKKTATPEVKVTVQEAPKHRTPEQDAKDALAGRKTVEKEKADANQALIDAGKVVPLTAITSYEHERAKLGSEPETTAVEPTEDK